MSQLQLLLQWPLRLRREMLEDSPWSFLGSVGDDSAEDTALLLFHARMRAADDDAEACYRAYDRYYQRVEAGADDGELQSAAHPL